MFFSWFCNMAMHIGMADLSVFRFARKPWYGVATASGMFLGHYIAWIAASILYALQLRSDPGNTAVLPGPLAYRACGAAGILCVIIAGWTTANPTIYRAGLAFQAICAALVALPRHARDRRRRHRGRHVPGDRDEAARLRLALRPRADAHGRRRARGLLAEPQARLRARVGGAQRHALQLGRRPSRGSRRSRCAWGSRSAGRCRSTSWACPAGSWPRCSTSC